MGVSVLSYLSSPVRREDAMKPCKVYTWFRNQGDQSGRNQGDQSGDEIQWLENDMRRAIAPGCFQLIADLAIAGQ